MGSSLQIVLLFVKICFGERLEWLACYLLSVVCRNIGREKKNLRKTSNRCLGS